MAKKLIMAVVFVFFLAIFIVFSMSSYAAPVQFSSNNVRDIDMTIMDNHTFVITWCDTGDDILYLKTYDTNGTNITGNIVVGNNMYDCSSNVVGIDEVNSTDFLIVFGNRYASYNLSVVNLSYWKIDGTMIKSLLIENYTANESSVGSESADIEIMNSTHASLAYSSHSRTLAYRDIFYSYVDFASESMSEVVNTANVGLSGAAGNNMGAVEICSYNSTLSRIVYLNSSTDDLMTKAINIGGTVINTRMLDGDVTGTADPYSNSIICLNQTTSLIVFQDGQDGDASSVLIISDNTVGSVVDMDPNIGTIVARQMVSASKINNTDYVTVWPNDVTNNVTMASYTGTTKNFQTNVTTVGSNLYVTKLTSSKNFYNQSFCYGAFILAWANSSSTAYFQSFFLNFTGWDGLCPAGAPPVGSVFNVTFNVNSDAMLGQTRLESVRRIASISQDGIMRLNRSAVVTRKINYSAEETSAFARNSVARRVISVASDYGGMFSGTYVHVATIVERVFSEVLDGMLSSYRQSAVTKSFSAVSDESLGFARNSVAVRAISIASDYGGFFSGMYIHGATLVERIFGAFLDGMLGQSRQTATTKSFLIDANSGSSFVRRILQTEFFSIGADSGSNFIRYISDTRVMGISADSYGTFGTVFVQGLVIFERVFNALTDGLASQARNIAEGRIIQVSEDSYSVFARTMTQTETFQIRSNESMAAARRELMQRITSMLQKEGLSASRSGAITRVLTASGLLRENSTGVLAELLHVFERVFSSPMDLLDGIVVLVRSWEVSSFYDVCSFFQQIGDSRAYLCVYSTGDWKVFIRGI